MKLYDFFRWRARAVRQAGCICINLPMPAGVEYFADGQWRMSNANNRWYVRKDKTLGKSAVNLASWRQP